MDSEIMSYCTNQDVMDLTGTSLSTTVIDRLIESSDRKINRMLVQGGLSTITGTTPDDIKDASISYSAVMVLNRHMVDGTLPAQFKTEGLSEQFDVKSVIQRYRAEALQAIEMYIKEQSPDADFSIVRVVSQNGERVGEYEAMTESEEDET